MLEETGSETKESPFFRLFQIVPGGVVLAPDEDVRLVEPPDPLIP